RKIRRNLEADVAVAALGLLVDGLENVAGILNIANGDFFVETLGVKRFGVRRIEDVGIKRATEDGLLKNGGVGSHAPQPIILNHFLQLAAGEQVAADVVHPGRLPIVQQTLQGVGTGLASDIGNG